MVSFLGQLSFHISRNRGKNQLHHSGGLTSNQWPGRRRMVGLEKKDFLRRKFIEGLARVGPLKLKDSEITLFSFSPSGFPKLHSVLSPIPAPCLLPSHLADSSSMSSSSCSPWDLFQVIIFVSHRLNCSSCLPKKNNPPPTNTHTQHVLVSRLASTVFVIPASFLL